LTVRQCRTTRDDDARLTALTYRLLPFTVHGSL
jgi:hypothetical protein